MRYADGTLIGDFNDNVSATTTASITTYIASTINENQTNYTLLPVAYNQPPIITKPIIEGTIPPIKNFPQAYRDPFPKIIDGQIIEEEIGLFKHTDGNIKTIVGTSFVLKVEAKQPNTLNIENGIPKVIPLNVGLTYVWLKDNVPLENSGVDSLNMVISVVDNTLIITNIQPLLAGDYTCEVSNDVGTTVSDTITIEVYDTNLDSFFYTNLIKNPNGEEGVNEWSSDESFTTENFTKTSTKTLLEPNRVDVFGYNADTMHPRPYQINSGIIKNLDYTKSFINNNNASYFTRKPYKYETKGGTFLVKVHQDIDLTDLNIYTRGGVYGVTGVRALFSCYIGNAINSFVPTKTIINTEDGLTSNKSYFMERPRISPENFVYAGSALENKEQVYITIEEFDENTRVISTVLDENNNEVVLTDTIKIMDPWTKRFNQYLGKQYYNGTGALTSNGESPLQHFINYGVPASPKNETDAILFTAEELYPNKYERFTYGQYAEFNKVTLAKINDKTTKIRITLHYETQDPRIFERWKEALDASSEIFEFMEYQGYAEQMKWEYTGQIVNEFRVENRNIKQYLNLANSPRGMITGLNLSLIPILAADRELTNYNTNTTLTKNSSPKASIPKGLVY